MTLEQADKERLARIIDFSKSELSDIETKFKNIDFKAYSSDRSLARDLERCIENIVNSSLDAAKIILVHEKLPMPETYKEYFMRLFSKSIIDEETASSLSDGVKLRNILSHQYLDIRWDRIKKFLNNDWKLYGKFIDVLKKNISSN